MNLSRFFYTKSNLLLAFALTLMTFGYLYFFMIPNAKCFELINGDQISLGTSFGFSQETVERFFSVRSPEMIACYSWFNTLWDNIFPIFYGFMYVLWVSYLFQPIPNKIKAWNLFPFAQSIFDFLENSRLSSMANQYLLDQTIASSDAQLASLFSMLKWSTSTLIFILILVGIGYRLMAWGKSRQWNKWI